MNSLQEREEWDGNSDFWDIKIIKIGPIMHGLFKKYKVQRERE